MKISHRELEDCRQRPQSWAQGRLSAISTWRSFGYNQALMNAIHKYHRTGDDVDFARQHLESLIERNFTNDDRIGEITEKLDAYVSWHQTSGVVVADTNIRLSYSSGGYLELGGLVSRLDVTDAGYRAVILGLPRPNWRRELRMPLVQEAIAIKYGRPVGNIEVGVQALDGSNLATTSFSMRAISAAKSAFRELGSLVRPLLEFNQ